MSDTLTPHPSRSKRDRRSTDATRAARNRRVVASRVAGKAWPVIAAEHGLSQTQVRQIVRDAREAGDDGLSLGALDPNAIALRVIRGHEWAIERLRELAVSADNSSAAVGAARGVASVGAQLLEVLRITGLAPQHGVRWPTVDEWRDIVDDLVRAAQADGIEPTAVLEAFEGARAAYRGLERVDGTQ